MAQRTEVEAPPNQPAETSSGNDTHSETHSAPPPPEYRRPDFFQANPRARVVLVIAAIVVLVGGFFAWRYFSSYESTDDARGRRPPDAAQRAHLRLRLKVNVDDNQFVHKGDGARGNRSARLSGRARSGRAESRRRRGYGAVPQYQRSGHVREHDEPNFLVPGGRRRCTGGNRSGAAAVRRRSGTACCKPKPMT